MKHNNAAIAERSLEIIRNGTYLMNDRKINVADRIAFAMEHAFTLAPEETDAMLAKHQVNETGFTTELIVKNATTIEALQGEDGRFKIGLLNFASAKNPGGGFIGGASAQEESLARSSSLYATIKDSEMYAFNKSRTTFIYSDYMIYSPEILFWMDDAGNLLEHPLVADVITAPAPNKGAMLQHDRQEELEQLEEAFRTRIDKVLALALDQKIECLILGAWGCGVFRNDPDEVAGYFRELIEGRYKNQFRKIVFAVSNRPGKEACFLSFQKICAHEIS